MGKQSGTPRAEQPRCVNLSGEKTCNHPRSFHGKRGGRCRALGCACKRLRLAPRSGVAA